MSAKPNRRPKSNTLEELRLHHAGGEQFSHIQWLSAEIPDVLARIHEVLGELIKDGAETGMAPVKSKVSDMALDIGIELVKLEKIRDAAATGTHASKAILRGINAEASKLLDNMRSRVYEIITYVEDYQAKVKSGLLEEVKQLEKEQKSIKKYLPRSKGEVAAENVEKDDATLIAEWQEALREAENDEERIFISRFIEFIEKSLSLKQRIPQAGIDFDHLRAFEEKLQKSCLVRIHNIQKLALERAGGNYL